MYPVKKNRRLVAFLYALMRDHIATGVVNGMVIGNIEYEGEVPVAHFTNEHLAKYAEELAELLTTKVLSEGRVFCPGGCGREVFAVKGTSEMWCEECLAKRNQKDFAATLVEVHGIADNADDSLQAHYPQLNAVCNDEIVEELSETMDLVQKILYTIEKAFGGQASFEAAQRNVEEKKK